MFFLILFISKKDSSAIQAAIKVTDFASQITEYNLTLLVYGKIHMGSDQ